MYSAVNKRPVVGVEVIPDPRAEVAASSMVSIVSVFAQDEPLAKIPDKHSTITVGIPWRILPVRSMDTGRRIVWSARIVTSNPLMPLEFCRKTKTRSCDPTVPVIDAGDEGQLEAPLAIIQTTPVDAA